MQPKILFDVAPNKCLQNAILSLVYDKSTPILTVLQWMLRASCGNGSGSGAGQNVESLANVYATEHALRYIGAYVLISVTGERNDAPSIDVIECWTFGSKNGFCIGHIAWEDTSRKCILATWSRLQHRTSRSNGILSQ